jgi:hypothetical protein
MKNKVVISIFILFGLLISSASFANEAIDSSEYKMLLKPSFFTNPEKGCNKFWQIVEKTAEKHGLKTKTKDKKYPARHICFLDSKEHSLYKKGFILRLRGQEVVPNTRLADIEVKDDAEMTLKFRSIDAESAVIAPVKPDSSYDNDMKVEEDLGIKLGKISTVFSRSGRIYQPGKIPGTIKEIHKYFPGMKKIKFNLSEKLEVVNAVNVVEKRYVTGKLYYGKKKQKIKTIFSLWYKKGSNKPFIAEFSFKTSFNERTPKDRSTKRKIINDFFTELAQKSKDILNPKQTKTGSVYQMK